MFGQHGPALDAISWRAAAESAAADAKTVAISRRSIMKELRWQTGD